MSRGGTVVGTLLDFNDHWMSFIIPCTAGGNEGGGSMVKFWSNACPSVSELEATWPVLRPYLGHLETHPGANGCILEHCMDIWDITCTRP